MKNRNSASRGATDKGVTTLPWPTVCTRGIAECSKSIAIIGDRTILDRPMVGLICSVQCPGSIILKSFDAVRELRDAGIVVAGGFHSDMERECLIFLLRGKQPVVACPAKGLGNYRLPAAWKTAIDERRLLLVSPFADSVRRTTKAQAQARNEFVATLAAAVIIPHASPGGKAEAIAREVLKADKPLFTFDDAENETLLTAGAKHYDIDGIRATLTSSNMDASCCHGTSTPPHEEM